MGREPNQLPGLQLPIETTDPLVATLTYAAIVVLHSPNQVVAILKHDIEMSRAFPGLIKIDPPFVAMTS
jgi:hypothetical protein